MEGRKKGGKPSALPEDFLKMVQEVFTTNFDSGLKAYTRFHAKPRFAAQGEIYRDEIVLSVSLLSADEIAATTVYGSADFDPKASSPSAQDLLGSCVDAVGAVFGQLLDPKFPDRIERLAVGSLSDLEDVPFEWAPLEIDGRRIHVRIDKANPELDRMADDWLAKNDPQIAEREAEEQKETEKLFVTGPKKRE